jgi:hypothetical protein
MTTLPTIHLNGTGASTLLEEYSKVAEAIAAATTALEQATCNARDFYPQEPGNWEKARQERTDAFAMLRQLQDYADGWRFHAHDRCRR